MSITRFASSELGSNRARVLRRACIFVAYSLTAHIRLFRGRRAVGSGGCTCMLRS